LAAHFDIEDLARGMAWVISDDERHARLSARARAKFMANFALDRVAEQYSTLYLEILETRPTIVQQSPASQGFSKGI
jgi:glycosyltransferase involved in cell wall biosynthesis